MEKAVWQTQQIILLNFWHVEDIIFAMARRANSQAKLAINAKCIALERLLGCSEIGRIVSRVQYIKKT